MDLMSATESWLPRPSRREMLHLAGNGFGLLGLAALLADQGFAGPAAAPGDRAADPLAGRAPHHAARARRCIFLYMPGGPSHLDTFDPKPRVSRDNGKPLPFAKP